MVLVSSPVMMEMESMIVSTVDTWMEFVCVKRRGSCLVHVHIQEKYNVIFLR